MEDEIVEETIEFSEELYQQNMKENEFTEPDELDGIGDDINENS